MRRYVRVKTLYRCFWGWMYVAAEAVSHMSPGLTVEVKRRRYRLTLFSRLLQAERSEICPRCKRRVHARRST